MDAEDSNLYNECENDKCVNPAHHYQGALGKIRKRVAREKAPKVLDATFEEVNEWVSNVFDYFVNKFNRGWNPSKEGYTFKELETIFVPGDVPTADDLRKTLNCRRGKTLFTLTEGIWYVTGLQSTDR